MGQPASRLAEWKERVSQPPSARLPNPFFPTPTSTPECQLVSQPAIAKTPLHSLRLRAIPFKRLGMDLIGPSPECKWLSLCISSGVLLTRYPEALPLHTISAKSVLQALFQFISRAGILKEILTDQHPSFMSHTLKEVYKLGGIKSVRTSGYHPQSDGLVEPVTLKVHKFIHKDECN